MKAAETTKAVAFSLQVTPEVEGWLWLAVACYGLILPLQSPLHRNAISLSEQFFCIGFQTTIMSTEALVGIDLQGKLKRVASGKVRDVFEIDSETLLFVASDRISAYDVIMKNVSQPDIFFCSIGLSQAFNLFPTFINLSLASSFHSPFNCAVNSVERSLRKHHLQLHHLPPQMSNHSAFRASLGKALS